MSAHGPDRAGLPRLGWHFGHYRLDGILGRGGMGIVYRATDTRLERTVALKFLAPDLADDAPFRERFLRESRLAAAIEHPGIVPIFEAAECDGVLYMAMRYVPGSDLGAVLRLEGPLSVPRTLGLAAQLADALDAAHRRGLVHRDVKPANVLVEKDGQERAYLVDFGLTKRAGEAAGLSRVGPLGTVDYMAPEQVEGRAADGRADQYSLACLIFHCLTGRPPFDGDTETAVMYAQVHEDPPCLSREAAGLPEALDGPMSRALSKSPGARFDDCQAFVAALAAEAGSPKDATSGPAPRPRPLQVARPRHLPVMLLGGLAGSILLMAGGGLLGVPGGAPSDSQPPPGSVGPPSGSPGPTSTDRVVLGPGPGEIIVFASDVSGDFDLYALDPGAIKPRRLTRTGRHERSPAISPDGTTIAYVVGSEPTRDIWLMGIDGSSQRRLTSDPADDTDPAWSSDGRSLAFASQRSDYSYDIFEIRDRGAGLDERNARNLTERPALESQPEWVPGTRRLVISSNHYGGNRDLLVIDADDRRRLERLTSGLDFEFGATHAPLGGRIAFYRRPPDRGLADVYILRARGTVPKWLAGSGSREDVDVDWAPGGRELVYSSGPSGAAELYVVSDDGRRVRRLTRGWADAREPDWASLAASPDPTPSPP